MRLLLIPLLLFVTSIAQAEPFRDGVVAYQQKQYKQALKAWLPLAKSGHVLAQTLVGSMYAYGEGVQKDDNKAFKWLSRAAKTGSAQAQYNLGILYEKGFGTKQNSEQARKWFKAAADQGRKDAATRYELLASAGKESDVVVTLPDENIESITTQTEKKPEKKRRIHLVLNRDNNELLGPPTTATYGKEWVSQQSSDNYTIQLAASIEPRLINAFKLQINIKTEYAETTSTHNNRQWHAIIYGSYSTVYDAKKAISEFPDNWKTWQPWIKKFSSVKHVKE